MRSVKIVVTVGLILLVTLAGAASLLPGDVGRFMCGDVNGNGLVNVADYTALVVYMVLSPGSPSPDSLAAADMDGCTGLTISDLCYLGRFLFVGGAAPDCDGTECPRAPGGHITLDHVDGLDSSTGCLQVDQPITFHLRVTGDSAHPVSSLTNGFRVHSPDGIQWVTTVADTTGALSASHFSYGLYVHEFSTDGTGADTVAFCGFEPYSPGVPADFDDIAYTIAIGPIDSQHIGSEICLDSSWYAPCNEWVWTNSTDHYAPSWDGPHCFCVGEPSSYCGDVDGSGDPEADEDDLNYFLEWLFTGGPEPPDTTAADMNECEGVDVGDLLYLKNYIYDSGPVPCWDGLPECSLGTSGSISVDSVDGLFGTDSIVTGRPVAFFIRWVNNTGSVIEGFTNGYQVSSPDGADWDTTKIDTSGTLGKGQFDLAMFPSAYGVASGQAGLVADTVCYGGAVLTGPGMIKNFNDVAFIVTIGPIGVSQKGKHVCLDRVLKYFPAGKWAWCSRADAQLVNHEPTWDGPHSYTITDKEWQFVLKDCDDNLIKNKTVTVMKVTNNPPDMDTSLVGTYTSGTNGKITVEQSKLSQGDWIRVEWKVHTQPAKKHTSLIGTMYSRYLDNASFDPGTGAVSYDVKTSASEQEIVLDHSEFRFNLLVSVQWDADQAYLENLLEGFRYMSNYMYDVTNGQVRLDTVQIYDVDSLKDSADVLILASNIYTPEGDVFPRANRKRGGGIFSKDGNMIMPRISYYNRDDANRYLSYLLYPYDWTKAVTTYDISGTPTNLDYKPSRTLGHEFGHYSLGVLDEYRKLSSNRRFLPKFDFGMMDEQSRSGIAQCTELSGYDQYMKNQDGWPDPKERRKTAQWVGRRDKAHKSLSCWAYFAYQFDSTYDDVRVPIDTPNANQTCVGPNNDVRPTHANWNVGALIPNSVAKPAIHDYVHTGDLARVISVIVKDENTDQPLKNATVNLWRPGEGHLPGQGRTSDAPAKGKIRVLGCWKDDKICSDDGKVEEEAARGTVSYTWMCGMADVPSQADSCVVELVEVQGDYPLICNLQLESDGAEYILIPDTAHLFAELPSLDMRASDGTTISQVFEYADMAYSTYISASMGSGGGFAVQAVDDSLATFFFTTPYTIVQLVDTAWIGDVYGPRGDCEFGLDSLNAGLEKVLVLSSEYPVLRNGLDTNSFQVGATHLLAPYPDYPLVGENVLLIRYADNDLPGAGRIDCPLEMGVRIFQWDQQIPEWVLVGGEVDTVHNEVVAYISEPGVYGAFTIDINATDSDGDAVPDGCDNCPDLYNPGQMDIDDDGFGDTCDNCPEDYNPDQEDSDGNGIGDYCESCCNHDDIRGDINYDHAGPNIVDLTFFVAHLFGGGEEPPCLDEADVNADGAVNIVDLTYLVAHLFGGGPPPEPCP